MEGKKMLRKTNQQGALSMDLFIAAILAVFVYFIFLQMFIPIYNVAVPVIDELPAYATEVKTMLALIPLMLILLAIIGIIRESRWGGQQQPF